jgi:small-conductance mechanosensitive channel
MLLTAGLAAISPSISAQPAPTSVTSEMAAAAVQDAQTTSPVTFSYANRPIVTFRASVLGRPPAERAVGARVAIDRLVEIGVLGPIESRQVGSLMSIAVGGRDVLAILPADVDALAGETLAETASLAVSRLQTALNEVGELRRPRVLFIGAVQLVLGSAVLVVLVWALVKARANASRRMAAATERLLHATVVGDEEFIRSSRIAEPVQRLIMLAYGALLVVLAYFWLTFALRRFPYTRPWGESLRQFILDRLSLVGTAVLNALPGLFTVALIVLLTRFVNRIVKLIFQRLQDGRISIPWVYPETADATRKIVTVALWLFALATAYPYLPGSDSDAFRGVSVFVGLIVSLGSSGIVNQVMSGFTLTYSRALRTGDFVAVGDVEGTVTQVGVLSTKIRTSKHEDVTMPNAVVVSQVVTNYSRFADAEGVFVPTDISIGYDVPWRQVKALLLLAAARTPEVRRDPAPFVRQSALEDFYVKYTLLFCPERPAQRRATLAAVHANILDAFNEYGVQITSPNYEADPERPKVVPRERWFSAPAVPEPDATFSADSARVSLGPPRE